MELCKRRFSDANGIEGLFALHESPLASATHHAALAPSAGIGFKKTSAAAATTCMTFMMLAVLLLWE
jgi:hypothetical protein